MAHRRISEPGITRQVYFVRFDWPAFAAFRRQTAEQMRAAGGAASIPPRYAGADRRRIGRRVRPLAAAEAETADDCLAPIAIK